MNGKPSDRGRASAAGGFLRRLARDTGGNTLAMMAAFTIPLAALAGSAVDISRAYLVKVRLQQACDAGVLAGRKLMTVTSGTTLDATAPADPANPTSTTPVYKQAKAFFDNNFPSGWMQTTSVSFTPSRSSDGQVSATATATVPMSIMKMFGFSQSVQTASCTARLDVGDSDIMFVLDTTGSMACTGSSSCSNSTSSYTRADGTTGYKVAESTSGGTNTSKIEGLRQAVLTFYDTLVANADPSVQVRYGFVPYASSVNVGYLLPADNIVDSYDYQSRALYSGGSPSVSSTTWPARAVSDYAVTTTTPSAVNTTGITSAACTALAGRTPATGYNSSGQATIKKVGTWTSGSGGTCPVYTLTVKPRWVYSNVTYDTSAFKTGSATVVDPSKVTGVYSTKWQGCIEERTTTTASSFSISSLPGDLDPDLAATSAATRWRPQWPDVTYLRAGSANSDDNGSSGSNGDTTSTSAGANYTNLDSNANYSGGWITCPKAAKRLSVMTRDAVVDYLYYTGTGHSAANNDFVPLGGTYHDIGMIWGTRLLSPTGIFAADTAARAGYNDPSRYIVFMSDGAMSAYNDDYATYGIEKMEGTITGSASSSNTTLTTYHNTRFRAICDAAKARKITIFVVAFATGLTSDMSYCATSSTTAISAPTTASLQTAFQQIALQVAKLRLSQ